MAIPGITDRSRLPRLGKIRLGEKVENKGGKDYPRALDHFLFTDVPEVEAMYGKECKEIFPVLLPSDDEDVFFPTARKAYGKLGLFCACSDGVTAHRVWVGNGPDGKPKDPQGVAFAQENKLSLAEGELYELPCPGLACTYTERNL